MFFLNLLILSLFKIVFQKLDISKEFHRLVILKSNPEELSLDKQNIQLVLCPKSFNRKQDDFLLVFTATLPIRTFLNIGDFFTFTFIPKYFCAECVGNNLVRILNGDIVKGLLNFQIDYNESIILENIFIEIKSIDFFKKFSDIQELYYSNYILLNNITNANNGTMTLLRTIHNYDDGYFQIVRCKFESEKNINLTIGRNFSVSNTKEQPIKSDEIYTILDFSIGNINIPSIEMNICILLRENIENEDECFNNE